MSAATSLSAAPQLACSDQNRGQVTCKALRPASVPLAGRVLRHGSMPVPAGAFSKAIMGNLARETLAPAPAASLSCFRWRHPPGRRRRAVLGKAPASTLASPRARRTPRACSGTRDVMGMRGAAASAPLTHARCADRLAPCPGASVLAESGSDRTTKFVARQRPPHRSGPYQNGNTDSAMSRML